MSDDDAGPDPMAVLTGRVEEAARRLRELTVESRRLLDQRDRLARELSDVHDELAGLRSEVRHLRTARAEYGEELARLRRFAEERRFVRQRLHRLLERLDALREI